MYTSRIVVDWQSFTLLNFISAEKYRELISSYWTEKFVSKNYIEFNSN